MKSENILKSDVWNYIRAAATLLYAIQNPGFGPDYRSHLNKGTFAYPTSFHQICHICPDVFWKYVFVLMENDVF